MGALSQLFFRRAPQKFKFVGSPVRLRGKGHEISASYVFTRGIGDELMKIHCIPGYASQLYLAEYPSRREILLLDCGCPSDFLRVQHYVENVMNAAEKGSSSNVPPLTLKRNLKLVVSSHVHIDHSGAALGYHLQQVPIVRPTHMESSYAGFRRRFQQFSEACLVVFVGSRMGRAPENPFWYSEGILGPYWPLPPAIRLLNDGDVLPGFEDWVAVKIPGHTTHMIGLYHTPSRIFYTADLLVKLEKGFFAPTPVDYDWAYSHTLRRMRNLDVGCALMPHGGIIDVDDQYGSWHTILDNVVENFRAERARPFPAKQLEMTLRSVLGHVITKLLRSISIEKRIFTRSDLDGRPLPEPWPEPQLFTVLR